MPLLVLTGLVAGLVTGLSPCVLPVLPGVLAASALPGGGTTQAAPRRSRPYLVVAGLVGTFTAVTLLAAWLVAQLHLPSGLLRTIGTLALIVVGLGLLVPVVAGNVRDALVEAGIRYPVALDNDFRTRREWSQRFWPARYLIDRRGTVHRPPWGGRLRGDRGSDPVVAGAALTRLTGPGPALRPHPRGATIRLDASTVTASPR